MDSGICIVLLILLLLCLALLLAWLAARDESGGQVELTLLPRQPEDADQAVRLETAAGAITFTVRAQGANPAPAADEAGE